MKKVSFYLLAVLFSISAISFQSCDDDDDDDPAVTEFIADDATFANFMSWVKEASEVGIDPAMGGAHGANDSTVTRDIFFKDGQDPVNGEYPIGTLIIKHSHNPGGTVEVYTAMAKRGNDFNPAAGDWEWFMLNADGSVAEDGDGNKMRGANLNNGACIACHTGASTDYIFTK